MEIYDFTLIGGGPTGLFGAFYAGLRQMKTKIIDSMPQLGGQLSALYPEKYIYDVGGFPKVLAKDLVAQFADQALQYNPTVCLNEKVLKLERVGGNTAADGHLVLITEKDTHYSKTVLIAAGVGAFLPRKMDIPDLDRLEGLGVHYFVTNPKSLEGKRLVIVGGWRLGLRLVDGTWPQSRELSSNSPLRSLQGARG